jgi:hypothetical protein
MEQISMEQTSFIFFSYHVPFRTEARNLCIHELESCLAEVRNLLRCIPGLLECGA